MKILENPLYAGAYVYGRGPQPPGRRSGRDGAHQGVPACPGRNGRWSSTTITTAYVSWDDYLANQARLAANLTQAGARPPREGHALCQGIIYCGSCGHRMSTHYRDSGFAYYECSSRTDQMHTPTCRSITADTVDECRHGTLARRAQSSRDRRWLWPPPTRSPTGATAAAGPPSWPWRRARYEAERAERAFHACEPDNRLVARNLESRWEARLVTLARSRKGVRRNPGSHTTPAVTCRTGSPDRRRHQLVARTQHLPAGPQTADAHPHR